MGGDRPVDAARREFARRCHRCCADAPSYRAPAGLDGGGPGAARPARRRADHRPPRHLPGARAGRCSYVGTCPRWFPRMRVDVVVEEGCEAAAEIAALAGPAGADHDRAGALRHARRHPVQGPRQPLRQHPPRRRGRRTTTTSGSCTWTTTPAWTGTAPAELARFVAAQRGPDALHLGQGVLTYPREHGVRRLPWLADAVRPASDVSVFAMSTGRGTPLAGLHGELLLVRASVEATSGGTSGRARSVEDAQFALTFSHLFPGRSGWFPAARWARPRRPCTTSSSSASAGRGV